MPSASPQSNAAPNSGPRLTANELRRRFWHMTPGLLPFVLWPISHRDPISPTLRGIILALIFGLATAIFIGFRKIQRTPGADDRLGSVAGYAGAVLVTLWLFPADAEIGLTVLAILAFGDGSATLGGKLFRGPRLPWNREKSWSGLLSFAAVGSVMASLVYWGESHNLEAVDPGVPVWQAALVGLIAVPICALVESLPTRINDNIRVGVTATVTVTCIHAALVGLGT